VGSPGMPTMRAVEAAVPGGRNSQATRLPLQDQFKLACAPRGKVERVVLNALGKVMRRGRLIFAP
jgi:hypothetical protein